MTKQKRRMAPRIETAPRVRSSFLTGFLRLDPRIIDALLIMLIFTIAFIVRMIYIKQLSHTYFFVPFKGGFDDYIFDNWAREMINGNWLGDKIIFIYRMPLYAYFLWFIYFIFGHSYWAVYLIQIFIAALSCVLIYMIGTMVADRNTGFIAGALSALYGASIYFGGMLVGETLGIFVNCIVIIYLLLFQRAKKNIYLFLSGIFLGISMLARGNTLFVMPFVFLWLLAMARKESLLKALSYIAVAALGIFLSLSPIIIRNYIHTKDFVPISAQGGLGIYMGNAYGADGKFRVIGEVGSSAEDMLRNSIVIAEEKSGRNLKPSEVSNFWVRETLNSFKEHGAGFLLPLYAKKFILLWNSYEIPDIWDYFFFKEYIPILKFPFVTFSVIASLAFMGFYLTWVKRREFTVLYIFIFGYIVSLMVTIISSRYRLPLVPFLTIFSAYAIVNLRHILRSNRGKGIIAMIVCLAALLFSFIPIKKISFETSHNSLGVLLKRDGKIEEAIKEYSKAIELAPDYPSPYYNLGILYRDAGQADQAILNFKKALELNPYLTQARDRLAEMGQ